MAGFVLGACGSDLNGASETDVSVAIKVVSKIEWGQEKIEAIASVISGVSPDTAHDLRNYSWIPDLFTFLIRY